MAQNKCKQIAQNVNATNFSICHIEMSKLDLKMIQRIEVLIRFDGKSSAPVSNQLKYILQLGR